MTDKDKLYSAPWTDRLAHRSDPNRVDQVQIPAPSIAPLDRDGGQTVHAAVIARDRGGLVEPQAGPRQFAGEHTYYEIPMLKRPVWKWEIAGYFFFGGLSGGAYLLARVAERWGGRRQRRVARIGGWIALAALLPSPPLLIADLGDPKRFHHMLRVFKPTSPMNFGTWALTAYGGMVTATAIRETLRLLRASPESRPDSVGRAARIWLGVHDLLGIPFAAAVAGYTGVLLSCTANPLWCKNRWLGPLFMASGISTGAEAIEFTMDAMDIVNGNSATDESAHHALAAVDSIAHAAEGAAMIGMHAEAGESARALNRGRVGVAYKVAIGGLVAAELVKRLPVKGRWRRPARLLSAALGLAGGLALRWAIVYGGKEAAADPHLARINSKHSDTQET